MSVAERGPGRMTYAKKKKPFAEHDLRVTLECAGKKIKPFAEHDLRVTLHCAGNKPVHVVGILDKDVVHLAILWHPGPYLHRRQNFM